MSILYNSDDNKVFSPTYYGSTQNFQTKYSKIINKGDDTVLDEILIFDGGDKDGYEKDN